MSDYQEIPEAILSALAIGGKVPEEDLMSLATEYERLCREANERLRRCGEYLRRGLRSEAVHLASCPPELTEMTSALEKARQPEWERFCINRGLIVAPRLLSSNLAELHDAVAIEEQLEPLLSRHRLLSLGKAPLVDRIKLLRAIAKRDNANPIWSKTLSALETPRITEIRLEAQTAFDNRDMAKIQQLADEVLQNEWRAVIPDDLRRGLEKAVRAIHRREMLSKLGALLDKMEQEFQKKSLVECKRLLDQWQHIIALEKLAVDAQFIARIRPIAAWVADESRRLEASDRVERVQPALRGQEDRIKRLKRQKLIIFTLLLLAFALGITAWLYWRHNNLLFTGRFV